MSRPWLTIAGLAGLAVWVAGLLFAAKTALLSWLVAFLAFSSVPIGSLAILAMVTLVPGSWRALYTRPLLIGATLLPAACAAVLPLLLGMGILYSWTDPSVTAAYPAFKAAWLSPGFFVARQAIYWAVLLGLWLALLLRPIGRIPIAAGGLIAYALFSSWMGVDLTETVRPDFHSSIWGLLVLSNQWIAAAAFAILASLAVHGRKAPFSAAGAFTVALLAWAYLHAMQFLVIWSGDLPDEVVWYLDRGTGGWAFATAALFLVQGFGPFFALLSPYVRENRGRMMVIAGLTLAMRPFEAAWLILPGQGASWIALLMIPAALVAMVGLGAFAAGRIARWRPQWVDAAQWAPDEHRQSASR